MLEELTDQGKTGVPRLSKIKLHMYLTSGNRSTFEKSAICSQTIKRYIIMHFRANKVVEIMQY